MPAAKVVGPRGIDKCSLILTALVIVSLSLSLITMMIYYSKKNDMEETTISLCVSCEDVASNNPETMTLYSHLLKKRNADTGALQCCVRNEEQASALGRLLSKRISDKTKTSPTALKFTNAETINKTFGNSLAFAQKSLCYNNQKRLASNVPRMDTMCVLNIDPSFTDIRHEVMRGVDPIEDGLRIVHPGLYFVYKSINFLPNSNEPCKAFVGQTFRSYLIRKTPGGQSVLVRSEHTCCPDCVHNSETGFSGGVFQLESDDVIQVNVTGSGLVHISRDVTYVGLVMMSGMKSIM